MSPGVPYRSRPFLISASASTRSSPSSSGRNSKESGSARQQGLPGAYVRVRRDDLSSRASAHLRTQSLPRRPAVLDQLAANGHDPPGGHQERSDADARGSRPD